MPITHTFSQNTKMKSSEMNTNFDDVGDYEFVDYLPVIIRDTGANGETSYTTKTKFAFSKDNYPNIQSITFRANLYIYSGAGETGYIILRNMTTSADVTGSEFSTTSTSSTNTEASSDINANFASGLNYYAVRMKVSGVPESALSKGACLVIKYKI